MRIASLASLLWLALVPPALVLSAPDAKAEGVESKQVDSTVFNKQTVPHMKELSGQGIDEDIAEGYWYVLHLITEEFTF